MLAGVQSHEPAWHWHLEMAVSYSSVLLWNIEDERTHYRVVQLQPLVLTRVTEV